MIGKKFMGRYEIVSKLGSGGMAVVYKAVDTVLNRMVTVKILQEQFASNQQFVIRFRKEAQAVAALSSHPNIVNVFDVGCSEEGEHYLIMEYVEGCTLKEVINRKQHLTVKESLDYVNQILAGLSHAHSYGVIHRDIKPQNIMITSGNQVKIMDFGLALNLSDSTMTYDSSVFGSVYYIAPEIAQKGTGDNRADIYSTGIVMYEMLTGELPFNGDSPITIALQHVEGVFDSIDDINEELPYEVARVVDKAMAVNPSERYATAKKMVRDIKNAADENDISLKAIPVIAGANSAVKHNEDSNANNDNFEDDDYVDFEEEYKDSKKTKRSSSKSNNKGRGKSSRKSNKKKIIIIAIVAILILSAGIFAGYSMMGETVKEVEVPMVQGTDITEAKDILDQLGLKYKVIPTKNDEVEADIVITQSIEAGQNVKVGRTIDLAVSTGAESISVPSVVGKTKDAATEILEAAGFIVETIEAEAEDVEENDVIKQTPSSGTKAGKGSTVTITISTGEKEKQTTVPDVLGLTLNDAKSQLSSSNVSLGSISQKNSSDYEEGTVMYQSVKSGTKVNEGTSVNLTISKGPEEEEKPSSKTTTYSHTISTNYDSNVSVSIEVSDSQGERTIYSNTRAPGENVSVTVTYYAPAILYYYENGSLIDQKSL